VPALSSSFSSRRITENDTLTLIFAFNTNGSSNFVFAGRETPSVAGIINPGSEGFQKLFFGQEEIAIPVHATYVLLIHFCTQNFLFLLQFGIWLLEVEAKGRFFFILVVFLLFQNTK